jgi:hypothetical protein
MTRSLTNISRFRPADYRESSSLFSSSSPSSSSPYAPPAAFLREELAIRLSHRVRDLQELPDGLSEMENVKLVRGWYAESFDELVK